jgi:hypothetical protein
MTNADTDPLAGADFDPAAFIDCLVYTEPGQGVDIPIPPLLNEQDDVVVRRTYDLPVGVDAQLRALAAARNLSVEQLLTDLAQHAA